MRHIGRFSLIFATLLFVACTMQAQNNSAAPAGQARQGRQAGQGAGAAGANGAAGAPRRVGGGRGGAALQPNPLPYDLLLKNGHVIDAKNNIDRVTDVAIKDGKIAAVGNNLKTSDAAKTIDVTGDYVTPGLIDLHEHLYTVSADGPLSKLHGIWPDVLANRTGVTTVVDAGTSGWRTFPDFKKSVIDRVQTRVLVDLNIVGWGMDHTGHSEDDLSDMDGQVTGDFAKQYPGVIVGIKSAHFTGPEWKPYIEAVKAGNIANVPVMIDYGSNRTERPMAELVSKYLRPGDIYTHMYSGLRNEQDPATLKPSAGLLGGRAHGVYFDVGTGNGSFRYRVAVPLIAAGFKPDSISTDLHYESSLGNTQDLLHMMSMFLAIGLTEKEVFTDTTWHPAQEIKQTQLGHLTPGAIADVAVFSELKGNFGYWDMDGMKMMGTKKLECELTIRNGKIGWDANGISMDVWNKKPTSDPTMARHWTEFGVRPPLPNQLTPDQK